MQRRSFIVQGAALAAGPALVQAQTQAQAGLPAVLRIVVPFTPGGSNDLFARALAEQLGPLLGVTVVVDNKPGAGGIVGSAEVARARPDGGTLMLSSNSFATRAAVDTKLPFDPKASFTPLAMVAQGALVLVVGNDAPFKTMRELLAGARTRRLTFASAGIGSIGQLSAELLASMVGAEMTHVPYKGISPATTDLMQARVDLMITTPASVGGVLRAGQMRALGVTSTAPSPHFPGLVPLAADVPGYSADVWWGVFGPPGMAPALAEQLNKAVRDVAATAKLRELFARESSDPSAMTAREFQSHVVKEIDKWTALAKARGIKITE